MRLPSPSDRRGAVAMLAALMAVPLLLAVGTSVDYARIAQHQTTLQDAVDAAALAGATVYTASDQSGAATAVATRYVAGAPMPADLALGTPVVTAAQGTTNFNGAAYNVTVTVGATMKPTVLSLFYSTFTLSATATASNPIVRLSLAAGHFGTQALDWNTTWLYAVPMSNGKPVYDAIPPQSSLYEIGSNCNATYGGQNYSGSSMCNGQPGASVPSSQVLPTITATQPIAFALQNMTDGLASASGGGNTVSTSTSGLTTTTTTVGTKSGGIYTNAGYGVNSYNAPPGHANWFYSAYEALSEPPSQGTNYTYAQTTTTTTSSRTLIFTNSSTATATQNVTTTYPTAASSGTPNCSLIIQQVDPNNLPARPPSSGSCFSDTDPASGFQYAAMTCAQMNGKTYMVWWNDMGGTQDDKDYDDAHFTVSCTASGGSGSGSTQVVLTK